MRVSLKVFGASDPGKVRTNNEDAFVVADLNVEERPSLTAAKELDVHDQGVLLAVSDGMGGEAAGEVASALVVESLHRALAAGGVAESDKARLVRLEHAIVNANTEVFTAARDPAKSGMGATLTAAFVDGGFAHIAEVGDSRAYLIRGSRIRQMTRDQSFVQLLLESGVLSAEEAEKYPHKNVILQAMGQHAEVKAAIGKLELRRNDVLLLCSDGLSGKVSDAEMLEVVGKGRDLEGAAKKLIALANERGGEDNITVVLAIALGEDLPPPMRDESVTQTFEVIQDYAPPPSKPPATAVKKDESPMAESDKKADEKKADDKKVEPTKADDKKADDKKVEPTKADDKKADDKKVEQADDKKAEQAKADDKKADDKKADDEKADDEKADDEKADDEKAEKSAAKSEGEAETAKPADAAKDKEAREEEEKPAKATPRDEDEEEPEEEREEEPGEEEEEDEKKPEPIVAAKPNEQQRMKEMLTLAAVFIGIGLLVYLVFKT